MWKAPWPSPKSGPADDQPHQERTLYHRATSRCGKFHLHYGSHVLLPKSDLEWCLSDMQTPSSNVWWRQLIYSTDKNWDNSSNSYRSSCQQRFCEICLLAVLIFQRTVSILLLILFAGWQQIFKLFFFNYFFLLVSTLENYFLTVTFFHIHILWLLVH